MYVKLLSLSGVDVAEQAAWVCRNPTLIDDDEPGARGKARQILLSCIKRGHTSVLEHITASFFISGISRACSHQLVRHRIASYTQTSQRFEDRLWEHDVIIPPYSIQNGTDEMRDRYQKAMDATHEAFVALVEMGVPQEDARFVLPNAFPTTLVMTANLRSLSNFFALRLCRRAQWEIRLLAHEMLCKLTAHIPDICDYFGPPCQFSKCPETSPCQEPDDAI